MVSTTPPVTTMTLFSRYSPTPLSQADAKFDHWKVSGSDHGEPKISPEVFTEASRAHTERSRPHRTGTSPTTAQPIRTTWEKTLTPTSPARPARRPSPGCRRGAVARGAASPGRVGHGMAGALGAEHQRPG